MDVFRKDDRVFAVPDCRPMCASMEPVDWHNLKEAMRPAECARFSRIVAWLASRLGGPYVPRVRALALANCVIAATKETVDAGSPRRINRPGREGHVS